MKPLDKYLAYLRKSVRCKPVTLMEEHAKLISRNVAVEYCVDPDSSETLFAIERAQEDLKCQSTTQI